MRRQDTTTPEHQRSWRGGHLPAGSGAWRYPEVLPTGRVCRGDEYLACRCGWRLVEVARNERSRAAAWRRHREHAAEVGS
jgi:hypothetical protein